jgi:hypothetical protein
MLSVPFVFTGPSYQLDFSGVSYRLKDYTNYLVTIICYAVLPETQREFVRPLMLTLSPDSSLVSKNTNSEVVKVLLAQQRRITGINKTTTTQYKNGIVAFFPFMLASPSYDIVSAEQLSLDTNSTIVAHELGDIPYAVNTAQAYNSLAKWIIQQIPVLSDLAVSQSLWSFQITIKLSQASSYAEFVLRQTGSPLSFNVRLTPDSTIIVFTKANGSQETIDFSDHGVPGIGYCRLSVWQTSVRNIAVRVNLYASEVVNNVTDFDGLSNVRTHFWAQPHTTNPVLVSDIWVLNDLPFSTFFGGRPVQPVIDVVEYIPQAVDSVVRLNGVSSACLVAKRDVFYMNIVDDEYDLFGTDSSTVEQVSGIIQIQEC